MGSATWCGSARVTCSTPGQADPRQLHKVAGSVFGDFEISALPDGTEIALSAFVTEG